MSSKVPETDADPCRRARTRSVRDPRSDWARRVLLPLQARATEAYADRDSRAAATPRNRADLFHTRWRARRRVVSDRRLSRARRGARAVSDDAPLATFSRAARERSPAARIA